MNIFRVLWPKSQYSSRTPSNALRWFVWLWEGPCCQYCGVVVTPKSYEFEHSNPWSKGGPTNAFNGTVSCKACNRQKGAKTQEEYVEWRKWQGLKKVPTWPWEVFLALLVLSPLILLLSYIL